MILFHRKVLFRVPFILSTFAMVYFDIHTHHRRSENAVLNCQNELSELGYCSIGIHPWHIEADNEKRFEVVRQLAHSPQAVAIGEAGLDKAIQTPLLVQQHVFEKHVQLAEELSKPLIIHCVKAWDELLRIYRQSKRTTPWIIHGFRGKAPLASQLIRHGFYLSFGKHFHPEALREAWPNNILAETDEAESISSVYHEIANVLMLSPKEVDRQIFRNVEQLFQHNISIKK